MSPHPRMLEDVTVDIDLADVIERDVSLCRWGEFLDAGDEATFRQWRRREELVRARLLALMAAAAFLLLSIKDANTVLSGIDLGVLLGARMLTTALLLGGFVMTWLREPGRWMDRWMFTCLLAFTPTMLLVRALRPAEYFVGDITAAVIVVFAGFLLAPTTWRFRFVSMSVFVVGILSLGVTLGVPVGSMAQAGGWLAGAFGLASLTSLATERAGRLQFLHLNWERETRRHLEREVDLRTRIEVDLRESRDDARASARAKSTFLATMSHELRTPINGIVGMTELLQEGELSAGQVGYVQSIGSAAKALSTLLTDLLDVSRVDAGTLSVTAEPMSLEEVLRESAHLIAPLAESKQLNLLEDVQMDGGGWVLGDATRIRQIVLNLLSNAVKFTEEGSVTLRARAYEVEGYIGTEIEVVDTGIGIAEAKQAVIFAPFHQLDQSTSRRFDGAGLGLAISHGLVTGMGGVLEVESEEGKGSTFRVRIALPTTDAPEVDLPTAEVAEIGPYRILVVDDQAVNRLVTSRMLLSDGHVVVLANDGIEALEACDREVFDLIFMDISMPRMDGLEAMERLRSRVGWESRVPIVALTANALPDDVAACLRAGANGHEAKPVDRASLRRRVRLASSPSSSLPFRPPGARAHERPSA